MVTELIRLRAGSSAAAGDTAAAPMSLSATSMPPNKPPLPHFYTWPGNGENKYKIYHDGPLAAPSADPLVAVTLAVTLLGVAAGDMEKCRG
jgi:hypothetical protein